MKDSLFEMLMNFFERSLSRLQEDSKATDDSQLESQLNENDSQESRSLFLKMQSATAIRIFTEYEKIKMTKSSYQFIMRLIQLEVIETETMEYILHQLFNSESRFVTLQETKWTIRNILDENLDAEQLAFLDLVLYQKEDEFPLH